MIAMRLITSGLIIGALLLFGYLFWTSEGPHTDQDDASFAKEKPIILQNPEMSDFDGNWLTMRIRAKTARVFENKKKTLLHRIDGEIFSRQESTEPTLLFANSGTVNGKTKLITVSGDVRVIFSDGQKLFTENLILDQKKRQLYNKVKVRVVSENDKIHAERMRYHIRTGVLILSRPKAWIDTGLF